MSLFAALAQDRLEVHPGGGVSVSLQVRNTGSVVNDYRFEVLGPSAAWAEVEPAVLPLFPGQDGTVTLNWRPPRTPDTHAGRVPFGIRVIPGLQPEDSVVEEGILRVAPFYALGAGIVPVTSRGRFVGSHKLVLDNQSNADAAVALAALDPDALLRFRMRPTAFRLRVGTTRTIRLRVHPRRHKFKGHPENRNFQVFASLQGQDPQRVDGVYQQRALIAGWQFKVAVLAVLLLIAALLIPKFRQGSAVTQVNSTIPEPPTPVAAQALSGTVIRLTWSNAGQYVFSGYEIQENGQMVASPSASESAHTFTGLTPGSRHCYVIRSLDPKNTKDPASVFSAPACATTPLPPPPTTTATAPKQPAATTIAAAPPPAPGAPPAPVPVTAQVLDSTDIRLTWTPQGNPASFVIQDAGQQVATPAGTDSAHVFSSLAPASTHCYVIWAVLPTGQSPHVGPLCATTIAIAGAAAPAAPPPPTNVTVTSAGATSLQVSWQDPPGGVATGYQVFENGSLVVAQPAGATGATITGLAAGSNHCYAVRSVAGNLTSAFAPDACASAGGAGPSPVALGTPGLDSMAVSLITPSEVDGRALIGSTVTYTVVFNVPTSGSPQTVLTVTLPSGMASKTPPDSPQSSIPGLGYGPIDPALHTDAAGGFSEVLTNAVIANAGSGTPPAQTVTMNFRDLTSTASGQATGQTITVNILAVVLNTLSNADQNSNTPLTASAELTWNNGSNSSPTVTSTVTVANPQPTATGAGNTVTVTAPKGMAIWNPLVISSTGARGQFVGEVADTQSVTITVAVTGTVPLCPGPAFTVEWVSSVNPGPLPTPQSGQDEGLAYPRFGPDEAFQPGLIAPIGPTTDSISGVCAG